MLQKEGGHEIIRKENLISGLFARLSGPLVTGLLSVLAAALIALAIENGGLVAAVGFLCLPFLILLLAAIFNNPRIGLFMSIHSSFAIVPLSNYLPPLPFPAGLLVDFFLLVTLVATLLKIKQEDWLKVSRGVLLFISVWFLLTALQIFNPEARSAEAWLYAIRSTSFQMFITIILALLLLRSPKDLQSVLFIFLLWSVPAALNGIRQLHIGLTDAENAWLAAGAARTHVLFGKLRVFSYFTDAGTFGAAQAMAVVIAGILALNAEGFRKKLIYGLVAVLCFYGMAISGTRGALFVIFAGFGTYFLLCGKVKVLISGLIVGIVFFGFLKFTSIGNTNYQIYRMKRPQPRGRLFPGPGK